VSQSGTAHLVLNGLRLVHQPLIQLNIFWLLVVVEVEEVRPVGLLPTVAVEALVVIYLAPPVV
tara:strand:+ start:544 stop:732 length:189 start_codon:yes stop_codon:yes gene_type:complete